MAQSPEYPDLAWVPPRSFSRGRPDGPPRFVTIHYTAGHEGPDAGESGAAYDQRRTDGTSAHYHVDSDSVVHCVRTTDRSHTALWHGNAFGIHYELAGTVQTRAQWLDPVSRATIRNAARQAARDMAKWGIPAVRVVGRGVRDPAARGICGHYDWTIGWPEDGGDHTDPGPEFPWDVLLADIATFMEDPMTDLDYGEWGKPESVGSRTAAVLLADLWAGEQTSAGAYGPDKGARGKQLDRIEAAASAPPIELTDAQLAAITASVSAAVGASLAGLTTAVVDLATRLSAAGDAFGA
jgi:N-acetyl-anhydromuramyl-L-alanine amidase AmpD